MVVQFTERTCQKLLLFPVFMKEFMHGLDITYGRFPYHAVYYIIISCLIKPNPVVHVYEKIRVQRARLWAKPIGHDFINCDQENSKSEYRNSKQIQISNVPMTKTISTSKCLTSLLFGSFEFLSFDIVPDFGFRASGLKFFLS